MQNITGHPPKPSAFSGAKLLLFFGDALVVILRDDTPDIPFPDRWDFPGGGREGGETAQECVIRETQEEIGIRLAQSDLVWSRAFTGPSLMNWLFAAHLPTPVSADLKLGTEGQKLCLMTPTQYQNHPKNIAHLAERLKVYISRT